MVSDPGCAWAFAVAYATLRSSRASFGDWPSCRVQDQECRAFRRYEPVFAVANRADPFDTDPAVFHVEHGPIDRLLLGCFETQGLVCLVV